MPAMDKSDDGAHRVQTLFRPAFVLRRKQAHGDGHMGVSPALPNLETSRAVLESPALRSAGYKGLVARNPVSNSVYSPTKRR